MINLFNIGNHFDAYQDIFDKIYQMKHSNYSLQKITLFAFGWVILFSVIHYVLFLLYSGFTIKGFNFLNYWNVSRLIYFTSSFTASVITNLLFIKLFKKSIFIGEYFIGLFLLLLVAYVFDINSFYHPISILCSILAGNVIYCVGLSVYLKSMRSQNTKSS